MFIDHGAYFLRWRVNGRRHTVNVGRVEGVTKEAAEKTAHEYRSGERSVYLMGSNSGNMTFLGIFNDLCDSVGRTRWKDSTRMQHINLVQGMMREFHHNKINEITKWDVRNWYYSERNAKRPTRTEVAYRTLHRVMQHALSMDLIEVNPCQLGEGVRYPNKVRKVRINHENPDLGKFLFELAFGRPKQQKKTYETSRDLILLFLLTAVRRTALSGLRWEHVDLKNRLLRIPPEYNKKRKGDESYQEIPMARIVQRMMEVRHANRHRLCDILSGVSPLEYVFPDRYGKTHVKDIRSTLRFLCDAAEIPLVSPHDLRRTVAGLLPLITKDPVARNQWLGHKDQDVHNKHYAGLQPLNTRRKLCQDVADFLSRSIYAEGEDKIFTGLVELKADNRTEVDLRWASEDTLQKALYPDLDHDEEDEAIRELVEIAYPKALHKLSDTSEDFEVVESGYVSKG
jgi:integrase